MLLRTFADCVLLSPKIDDKLTPPPDDWTDDIPGPAVRHPLPARSAGLEFCGRKQTPPMPHPNTLVEPRRRAIAHHIMANHELQALEVMAFVLCAFPDAPGEFRRGVAGVMLDEQKHTRMHIERATELGLHFGDLPVNGYFWMKAQEFTSVLDYICGLPLTFEGRNLDHTLEFAEYFDQAGDRKSAGIMRAIHRDEIRHVAFGMHWLRQLKSPLQSEWEAYVAHLHWPLRPDKSKGKRFLPDARLAAGMSPEFIAQLDHYTPVVPPP